MSPAWNWIADIVLMLMLAGTLIVSVKLDKALRAIGRDRAAFQTLISSLSTATDAVKLGIQALRAETERSAGQIERRSEEADRVATDLSFLIEAAERAGTRVEERLSTAASSRSETSRPVATARKLMKGGRYTPRRAADPAPSTGALEQAVASKPADMSGPPLLPNSETATAAPPSGPATEPDLRGLAGITTRRRGPIGVVAASTGWTRPDGPNPGIQLVG